MSRLPAFFIPHGGGPCFFMDWNPTGVWDGMAEYLTCFADGLQDDIRAIMVISAHWEEDIIKVTGNALPELIYDYYGFPPHTYELEWPARGNPDIARQLASALNDGGIECLIDEQRGFDHGVFIPLRLGFPDAHIQTIQISLNASLSPEMHLEIGKLLKPFRDQGILIIGSGMSFHDVGALMGRKDISGSEEFDSWLSETVLMASDAREDRLLNWSSAPYARHCHPREEHLIPLHVVAGAATGGEGRVDYSETVLGAKISAYRFDW